MTSKTISKLTEKLVKYNKVFEVLQQPKSDYKLDIYVSANKIYAYLKSNKTVGSFASLELDLDTSNEKPIKINNLPRKASSAEAHALYELLMDAKKEQEVILITKLQMKGAKAL